MKSVQGHWQGLASSYDSIMQRVPVMEELYNQILAALPDDVNHLLDLGTGTGTLLERIIHRYPDCKMVGLDPAPAMLDQASAKFLGNPNVSFIEGTACNLGFSTDNKFDAIVSNYALHHLTDKEKGDCARECYRLLRPGGRFVFGDQHSCSMGDPNDKKWVEEMFDLLCNKARHYLHTASLARMILQIQLMPKFILKDGELPVTVDYWLSIIEEAGFDDIEVVSLEPVDLLNRVIIAIKSNGLQ